MVTRKGSRPASAEQRLNELGIKLPAPPEPFGAYVEAVLTGNLLFLSGMLPVLTRTRELALARKVLFTLKARRELAGLQFGLDEQDACDVLAGLSAEDFATRLRSRATKEWAYVFKPQLAGMVLYVKLVLLSADEIRTIRDQFNLTQTDLARLLRLGANTVSRWESGRNVQTAAMDILLRMIRDLPGSIEYLRQHAA